MNNLGQSSRNTHDGNTVVYGNLDIKDNIIVDGTSTYTGGVTFTGDVTISSNTDSVDNTTGALVVSGGVGIGEDLNVAGDLAVSGSITHGGSLSTTDSIIIVGENNVGSDLLDLGLMGKYNNGSIKWGGAFRDASDGKFHIKSEVTTEPTGVVTGGLSMDLVCGDLTLVSEGGVPVVSFDDSTDQSKISSIPLVQMDFFVDSTLSSNLTLESNNLNSKTGNLTISNAANPSLTLSSSGGESAQIIKGNNDGSIYFRPDNNPNNLMSMAYNSGEQYLGVNFDVNGETTDNLVVGGSSRFENNIKIQSADPNLLLFDIDNLLNSGKINYSANTNTLSFDQPFFLGKTQFTNNNFDHIVFTITGDGESYNNSKRIGVGEETPIYAIEAKGDCRLQNGGNLIIQNSSQTFQVSMNANDCTETYSMTMPPAQASGVQHLVNDGNGNLSWQTAGGGGGGAGNVTNNGASTDNAICRFDGVSGKTIQNSTVTVSDTGVMTLDFNGKTLVFEEDTESWVTSGGGIITKNFVFSGNTSSSLQMSNGFFQFNSNNASCHLKIAGNASGGPGTLCISDTDNTDSVHITVPNSVTDYTLTMPPTQASGVQHLVNDGNGNLSWQTAGGGGGGAGNVSNNGASTDNAICRFDGVSGTVIQNSGAFIDDSGGMTCPNLIVTGASNSITIDNSDSTPGTRQSKLNFQIAGGADASGYLALQEDDTIRFNISGTDTLINSLTETSVINQLKVFTPGTPNIVLYDQEDTIPAFINYTTFSDELTIDQPAFGGKTYFTNNQGSYKVLTIKGDGNNFNNSRKLGIGCDPESAVDAVGNIRCKVGGSLQLQNTAQTFQVSLNANDCSESYNLKLPTSQGGPSTHLQNDGSGGLSWVPAGSGGLGDVVGPSSSTDNALARFDSTTGKLIQNSLVTVSDTGDLELTSNGAKITFNGNTPSEKVSIRVDTINTPYELPIPQRAPAHNGNCSWGISWAGNGQWIGCNQKGPYYQTGETTLTIAGDSLSAYCDVSTPRTGNAIINLPDGGANALPNGMTIYVDVGLDATYTTIINTAGADQIQRTSGLVNSITYPTGSGRERLEFVYNTILNVWRAWKSNLV